MNVVDCPLIVALDRCVVEDDCDELEPVWLDVDDDALVVVPIIDADEVEPDPVVLDVDAPLVDAGDEVEPDPPLPVDDAPVVDARDELEPVPVLPDVDAPLIVTNVLETDPALIDDDTVVVDVVVVMVEVELPVELIVPLEVDTLVANGWSTQYPPLIDISSNAMNGKSLPDVAFISKKIS